MICGSIDLLSWSAPSGEPGSVHNPCFHLTAGYVVRAVKRQGVGPTNSQCRLSSREGNLPIHVHP